LDHNVISTDDGQKALEIAVSQHPKAVLVDMSREWAVWELTRRIKENPKTMGIKVIALTSVSSKNTMLNAFQLGAEDYMIKPFSAPELEVRIEKLLNAKR
jgi:DNA-binding response OmpR family regulator